MAQGVVVHFRGTVLRFPILVILRANTSNASKRRYMSGKLMEIHFVYCVALSDKKAFDARLDFEIHLIPYRGKTDWIEDAIFGIKHCLESDAIPDPADTYEYCFYRYQSQGVEKIWPKSEIL